MLPLITDAPHPDPLLSVLVLLVGGLVSLAIATKTGLNFLLALILVGVVLGPSALGLAAHGGAIELLAELGVAFLLFDIGLHLSGHTLWSARRYLLAFAPLQIGLATLAVLGLLWIVPGVPPAPWLAAALSLSSTAVVLQLLRDEGEEQTPIGRAALAALLLQDLFVILLLVMLPAMSTPDGASGVLLGALARLVGALLLCVALGRLVLAPLLGWFAKQDRPEAFTAAALFSVLSIAWLTHAMGLSIALGAFLAGVALAESRYASLVQSELAPFRGLLLSLFFLSVGLSIELAAVISHATTVVGLALGIIVVKTFATGTAAIAAGKGWGSALRLGLTLSQGSEFAFVVFVVAGSAGILADDLRAPLQAAIVLTIAITPLAAALGKRIAPRLEVVASAAPESLSTQRVVIIGFDATVEAFARALDRATVPFIGFTSDRAHAADARALGFDVHYADSSRPRGLALAAMGGASAIVIGIADSAHGRRLVEQAAAIEPRVPVYGLTDRLDMLEAMRDAGADDVVMRGDAGARSLAETVLADLNVSPEEIEDCVQECTPHEEDALGGAVLA